MSVTVTNFLPTNRLRVQMVKSFLRNVVKDTAFRLATHDGIFASSEDIAGMWNGTASSEYNAQSFGLLTPAPEVQKRTLLSHLLSSSSPYERTPRGKFICKCGIRFNEAKVTKMFMEVRGEEWLEPLKSIASRLSKELGVNVEISLVSTQIPEEKLS